MPQGYLCDKCEEFHEYKSREAPNDRELLRFVVPISHDCNEFDMMEATLCDKCRREVAVSIGLVE